MRVLITGACGFVGRHLARELLTHGHELVLSSHLSSTVPLGDRTLPAVVCDVRDRDGVRRLVHDARPDAVVHLAGLAHTVEAAKNRSLLFDVNTAGVANVCSALADLGRPAALLFTSSSFVYGNRHVGRTPISETTLPAPNAPYGASKLAAESVAQTFASEQLTPYVARPFNHIGPGQDPGFVCAAFAKRIAETPSGGTIAVGNLSSRRDFCDVRDVVRAYRLILERRPASRLFVLGAGRSVTIGAVLEQLIALSGKNIRTTVDPALLRPDDLSDMIADTRLAEEQLGWRCQIDLGQSLGDLYREAALNASGG